MDSKMKAATQFITSVKGGNYFPDRPYARTHTFYLSGPVESPEHYIDWFDTIRNSEENDIVVIAINSEGGDLFSALQFIRVMSESRATIVASVEGLCASAATMILMCADQFQISDHSMTMIHNYSGGIIGKGNEIWNRAPFEREWSVRFFKAIYEGFLSEDEIDLVLEGKDFWMDSDEVIQRLNERANRMEEKAEAAEKAAEETEKPKRRTRKPKKTED